MTIDWLSFAALEDHLRTGYPPFGLHLRQFFTAHARADADLSMTGREPESVPDIDAPYVWSGLADGSPFSIAAARTGGRLAFTVALPMRMRGDHRIDVAMLDTLRALPVFNRCDGPYIDPLPFPGAGWAVVTPGKTDVPEFQTGEYEDAIAVADYFTVASSSPHVVVAITPVRPQWIVRGPVAGRFVSCVEVAPSFDAAHWLAGKYAERFGAPLTAFTIHEGRVG